MGSGDKGDDGPLESRVVHLPPRCLWDRRLRRPVGKVRRDEGKGKEYTMWSKRRFSSSLVPGKAAVSTQSKKRRCICDSVRRGVCDVMYGPVLRLRFPS